MAVELLITKDTETSELVPIATAEAFHKYWMKGCAALELRLIPRFEDGVTDFTRSEIPNAIQELRLLAKWFEETQSPQDARPLADRVSNAIRAFERVLNDPGLSIG